jgi:hypothetical protein
MSEGGGARWLAGPCGREALRAMRDARVRKAPCVVGKIEASIVHLEN